MIAKFKARIAGGGDAPAAAPVPVAAPAPDPSAIAEAAKAEGNDHVKAKRFAEAVAAYTRAIAAVPDGPASAVFYSNRAAALLNQVCAPAGNRS